MSNCVRSQHYAVDRAKINRRPAAWLAGIKQLHATPRGHVSQSRFAAVIQQQLQFPLIPPTPTTASALNCKRKTPNTPKLFWCDVQLNERSMLLWVGIVVSVVVVIVVVAPGKTATLSALEIVCKKKAEKYAPVYTLCAQLQR